MLTVEITPAALQAVARIVPAEGPVQMLNLVRYRERASYGPGSAQTPCTGREAFLERYVPIFRQLAADVDPKRLFAASIVGRLVGPERANWDEALIIEYPSYAAFRSVVGSDAYREQAVPHRRAALEDARLFVMRQAG